MSLMNADKIKKSAVIGFDQRHLRSPFLVYQPNSR
jgi:hypothetical protein